MSYSNPNRIKYSHFFDFGGAGDETLTIVGPQGKSGRLYDYGAEMIIEVMNGGTVTPKIAVGTAADPDAFGEEIVLHGLAADATTGTLRGQYDENDAAFATTLVNAEIPADTAVQMYCTAATGAPTGQATAMMIIDWSW